MQLAWNLVYVVCCYASNGLSFLLHLLRPVHASTTMGGTLSSCKQVDFYFFGFNCHSKIYFILLRHSTYINSSLQYVTYYITGFMYDHDYALC